MQLRSQHAFTNSRSLSKQHGRVLVITNSGGFGKSTSKKATAAKPSTSTAKQTLTSSSSKAQAPRPAAPRQITLVGTATEEQLRKGNWNDVLPDVEAFFEQAGKDVKALTLAAGRTLVLYRHQGTVYCSDVNSTAYQFPMVDATIATRPEGPTVTVPLDGTVYDLKTGRVIEWCPKSDNMLKNMLATLKRREVAVDLPVFPTHVTPSGGLRVRL